MLPAHALTTTELVAAAACQWQRAGGLCVLLLVEMGLLMPGRRSRWFAGGRRGMGRMVVDGIRKQRRRDDQPTVPGRRSSDASRSRRRG